MAGSESVREEKLDQLRETTGAAGESIADMCGVCAQRERNIGLINVRMDSFDERLSKLEKTRDEKLDLIIDMLKRMI